MTHTRSRRAAAARLARLTVLMAASGAAITLALLVRSCEGRWPRFGAVPVVVESGEFTERAGPDIYLPDDAAISESEAADAAPVEPSIEVSSSPGGGTSIDDLRSRSLMLPVKGVTAAQLQPSFEQSRGERRHEAIDILAPAGTPVFAVESGRIEKLFVSDRGGLTIYQFDRSERFAYYYAHLSRYADGLEEGGAVARGDVIGYVGATGNAPPETPHLHFAIFELGPEKRWWEGTPIDPYFVWRE